MVRRADAFSWAPHPRIEELSALALNKPAKYIEQFYRIPQDETNVWIDFKLRYGQRDALRVFQEEWNSGRPVRLMYLKSRRVGLTGLFCALEETHCTYRPIRVGIVAHNEFRAKNILKTVKGLHRNIKDARLRPPLTVNSNEGIQFGHNMAEMIIGTCAEPEKVRGDGLQWGHLSEWPFFGRQFTRTVNEVCTTIAPEAYTVAIMEGTGKGRGSQAHKMWLAAKAREVYWRPHFLAWIKDPDCVLPFDSDKQRAIILDEIQAIEPRLMEKFRFHKLTPEQMHYAYLKGYILRCNQQYEYYCREFPFNEEEAWDSHGLSFFGDNEIAAMQGRVQSPLYFTFENRFINKIFTSFNELKCTKRLPTEESGGLVIKLWAAPVPGRRYIHGGDCSLGERGGTFSSGYFIDSETREMMCAYRGRIRPDEHAFVIASLGKIFNWALLGPEVNPGGGGMQVLNDLQRLMYPNIYIWRLRDDKRGIILSQKLGWITNTMTRPLMLNELRKMFTDCAHERFPDPGMFRDAQVLSEMRTFQKDPETGRIEATEEGWDDSIIGLAIAHRIAGDEVHGGGLDLYASYDNMNKEGEPFAELLAHYEAIADGDDPCDVIRLLTESEFELNNNRGGIHWLE
jgi:hypothetical protein